MDSYILQQYLKLCHKQHDGFSTQPFAVKRGVRQGDPLSAYLFIIVLEILCISVRSSKDICVIKAGNEELRLSLFADDLTGFLKGNLSLANFLKLLEDYGICSGLKINHDKSEIMLLGNCSSTLQQDNAVSCNLKIKKSCSNSGSALHLRPSSETKIKC